MATDIPSPQPVSLTIDQALQQALMHHKKGQLQDAERLYRAILEAQPNHPDANHNLGVLAAQVKQPAAGIPHFKAALESNPRYEQYWLSYIDALRQAGEIEAAREALGQARQYGLHGAALDALEGRLEPRPEEINAMAALLAQGRYSEVEVLAQAMTTRFPFNAFGWSALGFVLRQMGRGADALTALQNATALSPVDAAAHCNLGATFHEMGRLNDAEVSYRRALEIKPDFSEAHNNLGVTLHDLGRSDEAETCYRQALQIKSEYTEALSNLGNTLNDLGRLDEAESCYRQALKINPSFGKAHGNLAIHLKNLGQLDEAEAHCRRALAINPDSEQAYNNMGVVLYEQGRLEEAEASYRRALQVRPGYAEVLFNLGHVLSSLDDVRQAAFEYQKALQNDPTGIGLEAAAYLAVLSYLEGHLEQCRSNLIASRPILAKTKLKDKSSRRYWLFLDKLLRWHQQAEQRNDQRHGIAPLYVIGESHSLSANGVAVRYKEAEMRCVAEWISGCKQWHLGNSKENRFKRTFNSIMARLPLESSALLCIGEIDCRPDEGILSVWRKYPNKKLEDVVWPTVDAYVSYVGKIAADFGHRIIVQGVPCSNRPLSELGEGGSLELASLIRLFNTRLRSQTLLAGMDFLDVYALTDRGDGIADGRWHIDEVHLLPSTLVEAFDKFCLHPQDLRS